MPLFKNVASAETYLEKYNEYCSRLQFAGLNLPASHTMIIDTPNRPVVLYIIQEAYPAIEFCHNRVHQDAREDCEIMIQEIVENLAKVWTFNDENNPHITLAIDGQLSNWVWRENDQGTRSLMYIDTSTPLYKIDGIEQLDPELFLKSAPGFLRWVIRWLFLEDVMNRYYDQREVYKDLAANCIKEQAREYIEPILNTAKQHLITPLLVDEVESYYNSDKTIWKLFLAFRKFDRFIQRKLFNSRYEFILPEIIQR